MFIYVNLHIDNLPLGTVSDPHHTNPTMIEGNVERKYEMTYRFLYKFLLEWVLSSHTVSVFCPKEREINSNNVETTRSVFVWFCCFCVFVLCVGVSIINYEFF